MAHRGVHAAETASAEIPHSEAESSAITKAPSAILIIAQINEMGELASMLRFGDVTNEVASAQSRTAGGHAATQQRG